MDIPGMNPMQNRPMIPGQAQPAGPQPQVPDLILATPRGPTAQPQQAPATTMPFQAPAQAVVQQVMQNMTAALMEMGMTPTPQNQQMAQLLAGYGHGVNSQTMGILRQAVAPLPDKSPATMEAAVILLSRGLPVTEQNVMAIKQFLNSAPLPQQLQNLPQSLTGLQQQMQQTAQAAPQLPPGQLQQQAPAPQLQAQAGQAIQLPAGQTGQAPQAGQTGQAAAPGAQLPPGQMTVPGQTSVPGQLTVPGQTAPTVTVPGQAGAVPQAGQPGQIAQAPGPQQAIQQLAQQVQSGQTAIQTAATSAVVQQAAGHAQTVENRSDSLSRIADRTTAQKVAIPDGQANSMKAVEALDGEHSSAPQSQHVNQHLPSARPQDQQALQQLYLHLQGGDAEILDQLKAGPAQPVKTPEEALLRLLHVMQQLGQISGHLAENMQLRDFSQLFIQHQQIIQLTGLLEQKLQEFHQLFAKAFPELSREVQKLLQQDGQDMFSKLAQLIDENQAILKERLKLGGGDEVLNQALSTLRQLMEQVGFQVEKVQAHMVGRELLSQNQPMHVVPIMVHFKGEAFPAEICVHQDYDPEDPHAGPDANRPLKLSLTLETKHMGRIGVDLATLKDDMSLDLKVQTRRIKLAVDDRLQDLRHQVESDSHYKLSHLGCLVQPDLESRQSMLLPPKRVVRSLRRVEGVV
ncbi:MAG: hypothetical protein CVV27_00515 [Candidatus Melainabacteria bacterium HGW-Melainabacteria-1]|nr:MAG: hypothetical protein CVV27_00515 [Candidatus Melainabacteria bacterium HGW-Melainabacteria-1]